MSDLLLFSLGWFNAAVCLLNGFDWARSDHSNNAFFCGLTGMYAFLTITRYWP